MTTVAEIRGAWALSPASERIVPRHGLSLSAAKRWLSNLRDTYRSLGGTPGRQIAIDLDQSAYVEETDKGSFAIIADDRGTRRVIFYTGRIDGDFEVIAGEHWVDQDAWLQNKRAAMGKNR